MRGNQYPLLIAVYALWIQVEFDFCFVFKSFDSVGIFILVRMFCFCFFYHKRFLCKSQSFSSFALFFIHI